MPSVQLILTDSPYTAALASMLAAEDGFAVKRNDPPDISETGILVADQRAVERHPALLDCANRLVVIAGRNPQFLGLLWARGVHSVVFESDGPGMAVLAVLGVPLRRRELSPTRRAN